MDQELANCKKYYGEEKMNAAAFLTTFFSFADDCSQALRSDTTHEKSESLA